MGTFNNKALMKDKEKLTKILADADGYMQSLTTAFVDADMTEDEFKDACNAATRIVIIKAAVRSMKVMQEGNA